MVPNSVVECDDGSGNILDCDYNSWQEGKNGIAGKPSYAIITSRSYHAGMVQVALCDGSARSISDSIDRSVWRALGTRNGGEVVGEF